MIMVNNIFIGSKFIGHDSAIFFISPKEREIFGINTERVTRFKHDNLYPLPAIRRMLAYKNIDPLKIERFHFANCFTSQKDQSISYYRYDIQLAERKHFNARYKKELKAKLKEYDSMGALKKIFTLLQTGNILKLWVNAKSNFFGQKLETVNQSIQRHLSAIFPNAVIITGYYDHELCHAISSYYTCPFDEAILFTYDGWGDGDFSKVYFAKNGTLELLARSEYSRIDISGKNHSYFAACSIGGIYSYFTDMLGFEPESDEGKVEALAAYGNWDNAIYKSLMDLVSIDKNSNSISIDRTKFRSFLNYDNFQLFLKEYRKEDLAAAVQKFLEDATIPYLQYIIDKTGVKNLCLSGGVAANVIMNLCIFEKVTKNIYIVPAMADDGAAQGAAILQLLDNGYTYDDLKWLKDETMPYYGTHYSKDEILDVLDKNKDRIEYGDLGEAWPEKTAELLAEGKIGAIYHGKMEWGPRALGNRSIIADPRRPDFRDIINKSIKNRPPFQPFCPSMLAEEKDRLFEDAYLNKHMTCAFRMKKEYWEKLPSAIHIDGTSRVQFVEEKDNPNYYRLLRKVKELTGFGAVINTSFNKHGRTIVESPQDAVTDFLDTDMDYLVMEGILAKKREEHYDHSET